MKKIVRLTESDLYNIIEKSVKRVLRETQNDDIENGAEAYDEYLDYLNSKRQEEDEDMKERFQDMEADEWIDQDQHDLTDNELYNNW